MRLRLAALPLFSLLAVSCVHNEAITRCPQSTEVTCPPNIGGTRYTRPCDAQFETSRLNITAKANVLQKVGGEVGVSPTKLADVSDKTINTVAWLRDLCTDWNKCAIALSDYQERKKQLLIVEDNYFSLVNRAEELQKGTPSKGAEDIQTARKDLDALIGSHLAFIEKLRPQSKKAR